MPSKEEIEKARNILLRRNDIESAALILRAMILEGWKETGGRVNILKVATVEILDFIEEHKNKDCLDVVHEKVKANKKVEQLETDKQKLIEILNKYEHKIANEDTAISMYAEFAEILKGEKE